MKVIHKGGKLATKPKVCFARAHMHRNTTMLWSLSIVTLEEKKLPSLYPNTAPKSCRSVWVNSNSHVLGVGFYTDMFLKYIQICKMGLIIVLSIEKLCGSNENKGSRVLSMVLETVSTQKLSAVII